MIASALLDPACAGFFVFGRSGIFYYPLGERIKALNTTITAVAGLEAGHYTDRANATGCTVFLCRQGAVGGVDVRGGSPGTRETDLLRPMHRVDRVHGVVLSGGSAFGLDSASGVMSYLEEQGIGVRAGPAVVPIVSAAILFDLGLVNAAVRPGPKEGRAACLAASAAPMTQGSVGAGTGATVGKVRGMAWATKGGIGSASVTLPNGLVVAAAVAVNAYGGVVDHQSGRVIAGPRLERGGGFHDSVQLLLEDASLREGPSLTNTTIGVVATNATLTREEANFLAQTSHDGLALTIRPCHTIRDGDTMFVLATGQDPQRGDLTALGAAAVEVTAQAVLQAVRTATGLGGVPSIQELQELERG
ncbi:MAG: peptidase S58 family protein [Dehalococcoidia bacterium]|nr:peptidase S58 family protein [Dehalococcoidia bacterium]MSQ17733.1 peptidase S58 family protein [Dehalococcoidia bacterium]